VSLTRKLPLPSRQIKRRGGRVSSQNALLLSFRVRAWLEQNGDARQVASMTYITQIDPTVAAMMQNLVGLAQNYIRAALADAGKALLAEVQAMTPKARRALPRSIQILLPTGGLHSDIGKKR